MRGLVGGGEAGTGPETETGMTRPRRGVTCGGKARILGYGVGEELADEGEEGHARREEKDEDEVPSPPVRAARCVSAAEGGIQELPNLLYGAASLGMHGTIGPGWA